MSAIIVRPLASSAERDTYGRLVFEAFSPDASTQERERWERLTFQDPEFRAEQVRGAFRDGQLVGGYLLHERMLRMGAATISTACIGAVVTDPAARKQGVATVFLQDALACARQWKHSWLLLDGIPKFYFRYGYIDMFDCTNIEVDRSAILAQPAVQHHVRVATVADAPEILRLYQRQYGGFTGSFERTLAVQVHYLLYARNRAAVAVSPQGDIEGYLFYNPEDDIALGREIAADTWDALQALLQYHAHVLVTDPAVNTLVYYLPPASPLTQWMIDRLEVPDVSQWDSVSRGWGVRTLFYHHRFTGWMACLADFSGLMHSILPELQARWQRSLARWSGAILLVVSDQTCVLQINGGEVSLMEASAQQSAYRIELSPQAAVQWIAGYRPLEYLTNTHHLLADVCSVLAILFPAGHTWLPFTDWF